MDLRLMSYSIIFKFILILTCWVGISENRLLDRYCKPPFDYYKDGNCEECPLCDAGYMTDRTVEQRIDPINGAMNCYPCIPCNNGKYSNIDTLNIWKHVRYCMDWLQCPLLGREYEIKPNSTFMGTCKQNCSPGLYPFDDQLADSECHPCSEDTKHRRGCEDWAFTTTPVLPVEGGVAGVPNDTFWGVMVGMGVVFVFLLVIGVSCVIKRHSQYRGSTDSIAKIKETSVKYDNVQTVSNQKQVDTNMLETNREEVEPFLKSAEEQNDQTNLRACPLEKEFTEGKKLDNPTEEKYDLIGYADEETKSNLQTLSNHGILENSSVISIFAIRGNVATDNLSGTLFPGRSDIVFQKDHDVNSEEGRRNCLLKWIQMQDRATYCDVLKIINKLYSLCIACDHRTLYREIFNESLKRALEEVQTHQIDNDVYEH